ncbi:hypothetical protein ACIBCN_06105 [Nocardia sp. NPDC051052]|uniref:hypothetical protein n=1 Tax=Nocardia sp. NPDC051052 TaxID=3364322 RepID=UPI0037A030BC
MWQYALWGVAGALVNCCVKFLEDSQRVNGWPWAKDRNGPGGGVYSTWILVHLVVAGVVTFTLANTDFITNEVVAFGAGVGWPVLVKKIFASVESAALPTAGDGDGGGHG